MTDRKKRADQIRGFRADAKRGGRLGAYMVKMCREFRRQRLLERDGLTEAALRWSLHTDPNREEENA